MLHAAWRDGLVVFGYRGRILDSKSVASFASTLFVGAKRSTTFPVTLYPPGRVGSFTVEALTIPVADAAEAFLLRDWVPWRSLSPSLAWFARVAALARDVTTAGLVVPAADNSGVFWWQPIATDVVARELVALTESMPEVVMTLTVGQAPWQITHSAVCAFTTDAVHVALYDAPLPDPAPGQRKPIEKAARRIITSLATGEQTGSSAGPADRAAGERWAVALQRWASPVTGRSPLADLETTVRLVPPDDVETDIDDFDEVPWVIEISVAPRNDPSLVVNIGDLWAGTGRQRLLLDQEAAETLARLVAVRICRVAPTLTPQLNGERPSHAALDIDGVMAFMAIDAPALKKAGIRVLVPGWWGTSSTASVLGQARPATEAPIVPGGLDLASVVAIDWHVALDGEPLTASELRRLSLAKHELVHLRGKWVAFNPDQVQQVLAAVGRRRTEQAVVSAVGVLQAASEVAVVGQDWIAELLNGLPDERLTPLADPPGFTGQLRPYQNRGLGWLAFLDRLHLGGCLADDMGLGKTAQLLALMLHERATQTVGPTLVVCPLSVVRNWETESERFAPQLRVVVHHGAGRQRAEDFAEQIEGADLVITTYALAARDVDTLSKTAWRRLVADEAQQVKNPVTAAAKALRRIPARTKLALTGTPVENRLSELWAICDLVNPGLLGTASSFRHRFAIPIERHRDADITSQLRALVQPFLLRRSKSDPTLVPELPPKVEQVAWAQLTREQAGLYQSVVDVLLARLDKLDGGSQIDRRGAILAALTRLKQICNHPVHYLGDGGRLDGRSGKLARFDELIDDALEADERVLVFTQYREMGLLLQRSISDRLDIAAPFLHGGVSKARRDQMVDRFQSHEAGPILLVSLKAGGSGLNLTAASHVIHYDRWWNPAVENQASDRAWRIGQKRSVLVSKLVCQGTVEERIDALIAGKRDLADRVVGADEAFLTELSTEEIRDLIRLRDR